MDAISYSYADKAQKRIKKFIENPDSTSGVLTVPKTIAAGETITIPTGRVAILPDLQVDGDLVVDGDLFIPTGSMTSQVVQKVTSTDNAVVRFDGTTGQVQNSAIAIDDNGNIGSGTQSFNGFGGSGFKNYIINGNFDIWQRGTSQTTFGFGSDDRWLNGSNGTSIKTHSQIACTDIERVLFCASYFSRTVVTSASGGAVYKRQTIEDITKLVGKTVTLSFWAKANSNKKLGIEIYRYFGTGTNSPTPTEYDIGTTSVNLTSNWQKFTVTTNIPNLVGKVLGNDGIHTTSTNLRFWFDAPLGTVGSANVGQQSGTFDIAQVQLEEGSIATPFENRPYGLELSLCQRYYERLIDFRYVTYMSTGNNIWISSRFSVPKRIAPTMNTVSVSYTNTTGISYYDVNTGHANIVCGATALGQVGFLATIEASAEL